MSDKRQLEYWHPDVRAAIDHDLSESWAVGLLVVAPIGGMLIVILIGWLANRGM